MHKRITALTLPMATRHATIIHHRNTTYCSENCEITFHKKMSPCNKERIAYAPVVIGFKFGWQTYIQVSYKFICPHIYDRMPSSLTASPKKTQPMKMQRLSLTSLHIQNGYRLDDFRHGNPVKQIHYSHATK